MILKNLILKKGIGIKSEKVCKQVREGSNGMETGLRYRSRVAIE